MAKMFYSVEEAAQKLGVSEEEVRKLAESGRLQEFRDGDRLVFKVEQVDLLASEKDDDDVLALDEPLGASGAEGSSVISLAEDSNEQSAIPLEPTAEGSGIGLESGSGIGLESGSSLGIEPALGDSGMDSGQRSGVSIFDADELEQADPAAMTQVADVGPGELTLDSVGSGSGLMDLTRESDDTSLGMDDLLEDFGAAEEESPTETVAEGDEGLFEAAEEDESPIAAGAAGAVVAAEPYDGAGSGLVGGFALGATLSLALGAAVVIAAIAGMPEGGLAATIADALDPLMLLGAMAGAPILFGLIGFVLGRRGG